MNNQKEKTKPVGADLFSFRPLPEVEGPPPGKKKVCPTCGDKVYSFRDHLEGGRWTCERLGEAEEPKKEEPKKERKGGIYVSPQKTLEGERVVLDKDDFSRRQYEEYMDPEVLEKARKEREALHARYGFVPKSIFPYGYRDRDRALDRLVEDSMAWGSYDDTTGSANEYIESSVYKGEFRGLSQYPPRMAKFVIQYWGKKGGTLFDPCNERLPRPIIANYLGMHSYSYDICVPFWKHNVEKMERRIKSAATLFPDENKIIEITDDTFRAMHNGLHFEFYRRDNRKIHLESNTVDLVFSSPPYWDIEHYDDSPEQLGNVKTYDDFMANIKKTIKECFRILKPGGYIAWAVNDFRKGGQFYLYHQDSFLVMKEVGFKYHDLVVYEIGDISQIFAKQNEKGKRTAKVHEYICVCRKE